MTSNQKLLHSKEAPNTVKKYPKETRFANPTSEKGLITKIFKELK
jgi:hypothetical protein